MEQDRPSSQQAASPSLFRRLVPWLIFIFAGPAAGLEAVCVNSVFVRHVAIGALQAFGLMAVVAGVSAWFLAPSSSRHKFFARLLTTFSVFAILSLFAFKGKVAALQAAGSTTTAEVAFAPTLVVLVLQLGLAALYFWRSNQGPPRPSRGNPAVTWRAWGPVTLFVPLLLIAGFVGGKTTGWNSTDLAAPTSTESPGEMYSRSPGTTDIQFGEETSRAGEDFGGDFVHYHTGRQPLLGFTFSNRDWQRHVRISKDLRGIFDRDAPRDGEQTILARPGYAVAGLQVQVDKHAHTFRVRFARLEEGDLDMRDAYWSEWTSDFQPGLQVRELGGTGAPVLGLAGSVGLVVSSLSLLLDVSDHSAIR